jgi:hypothetical protein
MKTNISETMAAPRTSLQGCPAVASEINATGDKMNTTRPTVLQRRPRNTENDSGL